MSELVSVPVGDLVIEGDLVVPPAPRGVVVFAHGSGSSRLSPRNVYVAEDLQEEGYATLLLDLLTFEEEQVDRVTAHLRFDVPLLAERVVAALDWLEADPRTVLLPVALFGASTGAAAALVAATERPGRVGLVVSRGGRPDLAGSALDEVSCPVLLVVGGADVEVLALNEAAAARLPGPVDLRVVPGAGHLFEEPGTLDEVVRLALASLERYLVLGL